MSESKTRAALWHLSLFALVAAGTVWLGVSVARAVIGSELLESGTLALRTDISPDAELELYRVLGLTGVVLMIAYGVVVLSATLVLIRSPFPLRDHAWMVMAAILLYIFVPVEIFTFVLDARLAGLVFEHSGDLDRMREIFVARAGALAGAPFVGALCYYTIVALAVFRPFRRQAAVSQ